MNRIFVFPLKSTYLSSKCPHTNFFHSNALRIAKYPNCAQYTLLNFPLNICSTGCSFKWYLYLPITKINLCGENNALFLNVVYSQINYSFIKYHDLGNLCISNFCNIIIDRTNVYKKYVAIDISPLVNQCLKTGASSLQILLGALGNPFRLEFNKCNLNELPKLIVEDIDRDNPSEPPSDNQVAMEINLTPTADNRILLDNESIRFNQVRTKTPAGIEYNAENGEVQILTSGYYKFDWNVNVEGSTDIVAPSIALRNNNTGALLPNPVPTSIQCQMSGMALVEVNEPNTSFSLVNSLGGSLLLSDLDPRAILIVHRV